MKAAGSVVIVGSGQAGFQAAVSLREAGFDGRVTLIGDEPDLPYQRPPLSKAFLAGKLTAEELKFRPRSFYERHEIELLPGDEVAAVDRATGSVRLASGAKLAYEHLILATGARPRTLRVPGAELEGVMALRTLRDAERLAERLRSASSAVVIGGGFIGLEFAAVANSLDVNVTVIEALPWLMGRAVSREISQFYAREHVAWGNRIEVGAGVVGIDGDEHGSVRSVLVSDGRQVPADVVLVGIGVAPDSRLAVGCGLAVDNGVVVDTCLATADPAISAIGDCANYPSQFTGSPVRLESVQNATDQARCVAARIVGNPEPYGSLPWFWSDQGDLKLQLVGLTSGHDRTVVRGDPASRKFSVFCFRGERLLGVDSVNCPADHMAARRLLAGAPDLVADLTPAQVSDDAFDLKAFAKEHQPSRALGGEIRAMRALVHPFIERLRERLDETVDVAVLDGRHARFIDQVAAPNRLRAVSAIGAAFPLHCTANGKALLATLSDSEVDKLLPEKLERFTAGTITTRSGLASELGVIREDGVAFDREEHTKGICAVGAVVVDSRGHVAAISVPIPAQRFIGNEGRLASAVAELCRECSAAVPVPF